jgi:hypothetical protein
MMYAEYLPDTEVLEKALISLILGKKDTEGSNIL